MKVIFGLGNPEKKYEDTLHNLGFMVADEVASRLNACFTLKSPLKGFVAAANLSGEKVIIVKPVTYMNLSGECVVAIKNFYKVADEDIIIAYDDLDVDVGSVRFRASGSPGTHNGMRNVSLLTGSNAFPRIRVGTRRPDDRIPVVDYVLSKIPSDKKEVYSFAVNRAADCVIDFVKGKTKDELTSKYNAKVVFQN